MGMLMTSYPVISPVSTHYCQWQGHISSGLPNSSEALASELLEIHKDIIPRWYIHCDCIATIHAW